MFDLTDKVKHVRNIEFQGTNKTCEADFVGETCRDFEVRQQEHEYQSYNSEPARYFDRNKDHQINRETISSPTSIRQFKWFKFKFK